MTWALAALLLVQPVLEEPGTLRMVAAGPSGPVDWIVDGREVGATRSREPLALEVGAGPHAVVARTEHRGAWQVVVRLDRPGPGIAYVPAWSASSPGEPDVRVVAGPAAAPLGVAFAIAAWARSKRP